MRTPLLRGLAPLHASFSFAVASAALTFAATPAFAQPPRAVQPVPYAPSQPVPYAAPPVAPPPATSGAQGGDVVTLKGGGMIRGTLVEEIPNDHATVQMVTGQTATIPWDRIEHIDRANAGAPSGAAKGSPQAEGESAWVHVESDRPVRIEREDRSTADARGRGATWEPVCSSPCDAELPLGVEYRIAGDGIRGSAPFRLSAHAGERLELDVRAGSRGGFVGGIVLASSGPIVGLIGAVVLVVASNPDQFNLTLNQTQTTQSQDNGAKTVGVVMIVGGIAMTIGGILMITGNARTHVDQGALNVAPRQQDAWLRTPTWRDDRTNPLPKTFDVPLFHQAF